MNELRQDVKELALRFKDKPINIQDYPLYGVIALKRHYDDNGQIIRRDIWWDSDDRIDVAIISGEFLSDTDATVAQIEGENIHFEGGLSVKVIDYDEGRDVFYVRRA